MASTVHIQPDIICFCHLRWNFVYQRPQHLLSRFVRNHRVFIIEEPIYDAPSPYNEITQPAGENLWVVVPRLQSSLSLEDNITAQRSLMDVLLEEMNIRNFISWY